MKPDLSCERMGCNALAIQFTCIKYKFQPAHIEYCAWCTKHTIIFNDDIEQQESLGCIAQVTWEQISKEEYMVAKILSS